MTVNVDLNIPVPLDTDNYNLVLDLNSMKAGILDSLNDIIIELGQRPETNTPASFFSVTCTSTGVFGTSVTINSADTGGPLVLNNNAASFGLEKSGVAMFILLTALLLTTLLAVVMLEPVKLNYVARLA